MSIQTNRDLYLAIEGLAKSYSGARDLEEYLRALWGGAQRYRGRPSLSADEFFDLLAAAFTLPAPPFEEAWRTPLAEDTTNPIMACLAAKTGARPAQEADDLASSGFDHWSAFVLRQIVDLRVMAERGMLAKEDRYYGMYAPSGQRWYNFDPCTFLECAAAGSFGYWETANDTGRQSLTDADADTGEDPVVLIGAGTWADFRFFLGCGQWYE